MSALLEPVTLRGVTARNRVWLAPMCQYSCFARDGVPTDWHLAHLVARASGGFGLLLTEATAVVPEGRISPEDTGLWDDAQQEAWGRVVAAVHEQGVPIGVQFAHAGRKASTFAPFADPRAAATGEGSVPVEDGGWETVAPSAVAFPGYATPRALSLEEVRELPARFADAARRADAAGFDAVEVHAAHGYLLHQFLSPLSNERDDEYGGSFENRTRLVVEVVDAVRAAWPDDVSDEVEERFGPTAAGFGSVRVEVTVGATTWRTSVFPSAQQRAYVLPVKKAVRSAERLDEGGTASFTLRVLAH